MQLLLALTPELGLSWRAAPVSMAELPLLRRLWQALPSTHHWAQSEEVSSVASCPARGVKLDFSSWKDAQEGECWGNFEAKGEGQ